MEIFKIKLKITINGVPVVFFTLTYFKNPDLYLQFQFLSSKQS